MQAPRSTGTITVLKESVPVHAGEVVDGTFMSKRALPAPSVGGREV